VDKCSQYWPDAIDETIPFNLGEEGTPDARSISVTRIDKDPLQAIIEDIEEGLDAELVSSQARETKKLEKMIADKEKFEVRTFRLEYDGETREVTQYHVKFWNDNTGLLGDEQVEMRDFLHFLAEQVDAHGRDMATGPPIIHCRQVDHVTRAHSAARHTEHCNGMTPAPLARSAPPRPPLYSIFLTHLHSYPPSLAQ